jgi:hypothetical protein
MVVQRRPHHRLGSADPVKARLPAGPCGRHGRSGGRAAGAWPPRPGTGRVRPVLLDALGVSAVLTGTLRLAGAFEVERRTGRWWTFGGLALGSVEIALGAIVLLAGSGNLRLVTAAAAAWELIGGTLLLLEGLKIWPASLFPGYLAWASHANAAAHRAGITITADHPSWGDAWVVRRTARCGSVDVDVDDDEAEPHPCGGRAGGAQRRGEAVQQARSATLSG